MCKCWLKKTADKVPAASKKPNSHEKNHHYATLCFS
jgi:hypothetical protein